MAVHRGREQPDILQGNRASRNMRLFKLNVKQRDLYLQFGLMAISDGPLEPLVWTYVKRCEICILYETNFNVVGVCTDGSYVQQWIQNV